MACIYVFELATTVECRLTTIQNDRIWTNCPDSQPTCAINLIATGILSGQVTKCVWRACTELASGSATRLEPTHRTQSKTRNLRERLPFPRGIGRAGGHGGNLHRPCSRQVKPLTPTDSAGDASGGLRGAPLAAEYAQLSGRISPTFHWQP